MTSPPAPRPGRLRRGRIDLAFTADAALALRCFLTTNAALGAQNTQHGSPYSTGMVYLVAFVLSAPLVLRTRLPLTAWSAVAWRPCCGPAW